MEMRIKQEIGDLEIANAIAKKKIADLAPGFSSISQEASLRAEIEQNDARIKYLSGLTGYAEAVAERRLRQGDAERHFEGGCNW